MNEKDNQLQRDFENGKLTGAESDDANAYQYVFRALNKEPDAQLPDRFADQVLQKLSQRKTSLFKEYFWLGVGIFFMLITLIIAIAITGLKVDFGFLKGISSFKGLFIFGIVVALAWNFLEKRLLHVRPS